MRYTLTVVAVAVLFPAVAFAQTNATKPPVDHNQVVSTNPFGLFFQWYNGEYERKISPSVTIGASGSYFADAETSVATALARWYPQGAALDGFYLGARAGAFHLKTYEYEYQPPPPRPATPGTPSNPPSYPTRTERNRTVPGVGMEVGYNWLLGRSQNVSIGLGFGLTKILDDANTYDFPNVVPNIRLINIGIAF
jgi:hypothetical protein